MEPIIRTDDLCRDFPSGREVVHALKEVNISIQPEALTILRGRSGSGKTTLINLLGALDHPTRGDIYLLDKKITDLSEKRRDEIRRTGMGFVFQSIALIGLMSAYENVEFALRVAGYDRKEQKERTEECLDFVGLAKRMNHRPHELSGGEQQRVAIARAIAHYPKVLFADEPTAELDTQMGLQVMKVFRDLVTKEKLTVVMTTHDPNMMELADHVYTLEDGEIVDEI
ncbi:MAG TPA: ABC transporter ATP-binding protein [Clostridia bacterium]|nr:ABC transporter ATP-binding protein [Clostridia bacterium]